MAASPEPLRVSVVIETITAREHATEALPDALEGVLAALARQTVRASEILVAVDAEVPEASVKELLRRHPHVVVTHARAANYFAGKNAGAQQARGDLVAIIDGDCIPAEDWLERLLVRFEPGVAAVAGRTRYTGRTLAARTFSVPDFANVVPGDDGEATAMNLNNVVFRREVLLAFPFDDRIRRNGGCYLNFHRIRAAGLRVLYEPSASALHGLDIAGFGFVRKHYDRGFDGVSVYRCDDQGVLKGTRIFRKFGRLALVAFTGRRVLLDWLRMARHRRDIGISALTLPYYCVVAAGTRLIELAGGLRAVARR
jgi:glycosyltransferase involved in cell wall biosynthesis